MTWRDVLLASPGWLACVILPLNWWLDRRFHRKYEALWGVPYRSEDFR